jgi:hypothetical protein
MLRLQPITLERTRCALGRSDPFFEGDRDAAVRAQANLITLDFRDQAARHIMPVTGVTSLAGIGFGKADTRTVECIDRADMSCSQC